MMLWNEMHVHHIPSIHGLRWRLVLLINVLSLIHPRAYLTLSLICKGDQRWFDTDLSVREEINKNNGSVLLYNSMLSTPPPPPPPPPPPHTHQWSKGCSQAEMGQWLLLYREISFATFGYCLLWGRTSIFTPGTITCETKAGFIEITLRDDHSLYLSGPFRWLCSSILEYQ